MSRGGTEGSIANHFGGAAEQAEAAALSSSSASREKKPAVSSYVPPATGPGLTIDDEVLDEPNKRWGALTGGGLGRERHKGGMGPSAALGTRPGGGPV